MQRHRGCPSHTPWARRSIWVACRRRRALLAALRLCPPPAVLLAAPPHASPAAQPAPASRGGGRHVVRMQPHNSLAARCSSIAGQDCNRSTGVALQHRTGAHRPWPALAPHSPLRLPPSPYAPAGRGWHTWQQRPLLPLPRAPCLQRQPGSILAVRRKAGWCAFQDRHTLQECSALAHLNALLLCWHLPQRWPCPPPPRARPLSPRHQTWAAGPPWWQRRPQLAPPGPQRHPLLAQEPMLADRHRSRQTWGALPLAGVAAAQPYPAGRCPPRLPLGRTAAGAGSDHQSEGQDLATLQLLGGSGFCGERRLDPELSLGGARMRAMRCRRQPPPRGAHSRCFIDIGCFGDALSLPE